MNYLAPMADRLRHRGPDQTGGLVDVPHGLAMGASRLSIIDLAGGRQPIENEDGQVAAVFNGEIFDYHEHIRSLSQKGHRFRTHCDSEVIVHAYEEYGPDFIQQLNGQFAIALWDRAREQLWLFRDRFGICPLFYAWDSKGNFVFASEAKSIFATGLVLPRLDARGVDQIFSLWTNLPGFTCFEGVREVKAGHGLRIDRAGGWQERPYWSLATAALTRAEGSAADRRAALDRVAEELDQSVRRRLVADVPVGVYLSGGVDSSILTYLAHRNVGSDIRTFSVEFDDPLFDESRSQTEVRQFLDLRNHSSVRIRHRDIGTHFPAVVYHAERVLFRTAPAPLYLLSQEVNRHGMKVILSGEGADEIFWGYPLFKEAKVRRFWRRNPDSASRPRLLERIFPFMPQYSRRYVHLLIDSYRRSLDFSGPLDTHRTRFASCAHQKKFYSRDLRARLNGYDALEDLEVSLRDDLEKVNYLQSAQLIEQATLLTGYLLCSQGDRMSMAHSVEARFPYLDHELVASLFALPDDFKLFGLNDKWALRKSFAGRLPDSVVNRLKHPYQAPDVKGFLYEDGTEVEYLGELLGPRRLEETGFFDSKVVDRFLHKLRTVSVERFSTQDNMALVQLLSTQLLSARFEGGLGGGPREPRGDFPVTVKRR